MPLCDMSQKRGGGLSTQQISTKLGKKQWYTQSFRTEMLLQYKHHIGQSSRQACLGAECKECLTLLGSVHSQLLFCMHPVQMSTASFLQSSRSVMVPGVICH